jgi:hypothetical protein
MDSPKLRAQRNKLSKILRIGTSVHLVSFLALLLVSLFTSSCTPASSQNAGLTTGSSVGVQITPNNAELQSAGSIQFTANITGTTSTAVTWKTNVGNITSSGLYTAPAVTSTRRVVVTATGTDSADNQPPSGTASITILPTTPGSGLQILTTSLPPATIGVPYDVPIDASGGTQPYAWSASGLPAGLTLNSGIISGIPTEIGSYSFNVQVTDNAAQSATWSPTVTVSNQDSSGYDGPAQLPLVYVQTAMTDTPAPGNTTLVAAGGDLQTALNNAQCGDTVELQAGATFTGLFTLPAKSCDSQHWIIIRTSAPDSSLPGETVRISPCYAGVSSLPGRPALNCTSTQNILARVLYYGTGDGPIQFANGANYYRLIGLEITRPAGTGYVASLVSAQKGSTANNVIVDRSWVHGSSQDDTETGVALGGLTAAAVINSYLSDFHCTAIVGTCVDSHAISGGCGSFPGGPYAILNNFLEASGENILFGGGAAATTPTDIQISQNHFFKPLTWMSGQPGYVGGPGGHPFIVKNHLELKNAQRVLAEGNILEYSWGGFSQEGHSILLTPKDQYDGLLKANVCPLCKVTDVTIRYSTISHVGGGIAMATSPSDGGGQASAGERYSVHDVVIDDISASNYNGGGGFLEFGNGWTANVINSVTVNHVTAFPDKHFLLLWNNKTNPTMWGFTFTNNIVNATLSPVENGNGNPSSCAVSDIPLKSLATCFKSSYIFTNNVIPSLPSQYPASTWPASNFFPASDEAVQFVNYNNGNGGNYQLLPTSPYKNAGTDGKDPGADIDLVSAAVTGVY